MRNALALAFVGLMGCSGCATREPVTFAPSPPDTGVVLIPGVVRALDFLYAEITAPQAGVEFTACLEGYRSQGFVWIERIYMADQRGNGWGRGSVVCRNALGVVHTHPPSVSGCRRSSTDEAHQLRFGYRVALVWCGSRRFRWYLLSGASGGMD